MEWNDWTLTWDVFKYTSLVKSIKVPENWTLTWDVFKCIRNCIFFISFYIEH